jgi:hypothetical protein
MKKNRGLSIINGSGRFSSHAFRGPSWADLKLINQSSLLPLSPLSACAAACHALLLTLLLSNGLKVEIPPPFPFYRYIFMPELKSSRPSALKELVVVLHDHFSTKLNYADFTSDLSSTLANYVQVHENEEGHKGSRKLLEQLRELASRSANGGPSKLPLLLKCLKDLKEVLEPEDVIDMFEDSILQPILNFYGMSRQTVSDAREVLIFCLSPPEHSIREPRLTALHYRLFDLYMQKSQEVLEGLVMANMQMTKYIMSNLEKVLLEFGASCPKV